MKIETETKIIDPSSIKKLTEWENEPTVADLKQDFTDAKQSHTNHVTNVTRWLNNLNITGSTKRPKQTNKSSVVPKVIRKQAEWRYAALSEPFLSTDDLFNTAPETFEDKEAAVQAGLVLNHQFNTKIKKVAFIDEYVRTVVDEGTVIVRVGWEFEEEEVEVDVPDFELVSIRDPAIVQQMLSQGLEPVEKIQVGSHIELQMKTIKNHPTVEVCDYNNTIIDPTCLGDIDAANFIIYKFKTNKSKLEKKGSYFNLDIINMNTASVLSEADESSKDETNFTFKDKPRQEIIAYEYWGYWDIDKTGIVKPIKATYVGDVMIQLEENPFPDKKAPFVAVSYLPVRKSIYGEPDGELLEDNQNIIGAVTRGMIDIMGRSANGQMGIQKNALDITNRRRFDKGLDYEFNPNSDPRNVFFTHTFSPIPSSAEYMLQQQHADAESLTGVKAFHQGITGESLGATATGIRKATDATAKRELGILRRLAIGIVEIGRKIMAMNTQFLSDEEIIRITNEEFVTIKKDDLDGKYDVNLTISTADADNEKAQDLSFMMQTMGNTMDFGMTKLLLKEIATLRKMPTLAKQIENFQPQPDPLVQKEKELKLMLLEAQIGNERAKALENQADIEYKKQKTLTEIAKQRSLNTQADKSDLDYLEQDQGVSHAREMEKEDFKLKAELDKKAADHILSVGKGVSPKTGASSPTNNPK